MDRCIPTLEAALKPKGPFGGGPFLNSPGQAASHRIVFSTKGRVAAAKWQLDQTTSQNKRVLSIKKNCLKLKNQCFCLENKTCTIVFPDIPPWGKVFYVFWGVQILPHLFGVYGSPGKEFAINSPNSKAAFLWIVSQCWDTIDSNPDFFQRRCQCHGNLPLLNSCFWFPW